MSEQNESPTDESHNKEIPELGEDVVKEKEEKVIEKSSINQIPTNDSLNTSTINQIQKKQVLIAISSALGALLLLLILYLIFKKRDNVNQYDHPIPYVFDNQFKQYLNEYTDFSVQNHLLLIHGPPGIGKTRGLKEFSDELVANNRLVIDIDFTKLSPVATNKDLVVLLQTSVMKSFRNIDGKSFRSSSLRQVLQYLESVKSILTNKQLETITKIDIKDILISKISESLSLILTNMNYSVGTLTFFDSLEAISPILRPLVILHDPQISNEFFRSLLSISSTYMHDTKNVAIIVEVSDQVSLIKDYTNMSQFKLVRVNEFKTEDAKKLLVDTKKIFTKQQLFQLNDLYGGVGQLYASIHELIRERITFQDAVNQVTKETRAIAIRSIFDSKYQSNIDERLSLMKQIKDNGEVPYNIYEKASFHLLKHGVISLWNASHVSFSNKIFANLK